MEPPQSSETSAYKTQTPRNYPEESTLQLETLWAIEQLETLWVIEKLETLWVIEPLETLWVIEQLETL
jgi:hypothetical protein